MENDYLEFYGEHHISPVSQNVSDIKKHYERRKKLYRQCGIPILTFRNAEVLEVGPGSGYNTLAFFQWNCKHVDLVEANPKGIEDMMKSFKERNIPDNKYEIFQCKIEDYTANKKYDIVIAEGFLPSVFNQEEIILKLQSLAADNGIVVITCVDYVSCFIESMKRLLGRILVKDILSYEDKVKCLTEIFEPQLSKLKGVSRPAEDWVQDNILNPAASNKIVLSLGQAIGYFREKFEVLGTSPRMFTDYSWYKDIWYDFQKDCRRQFQKKHMSLIMTNMPEQEMDVTQAEKLDKHFDSIRELAVGYEQTLDINVIGNILVHMSEIEREWKDMDAGFMQVFHEIYSALTCILETGTVNMEDYPHFFAAFGRSQQYIAFEKSEE